MVTFFEMTNGCSVFLLGVRGVICFLLRGTGIREGGTVDVVPLWRGNIIILLWVSQNACLRGCIGRGAEHEVCMPLVMH